MSVVCTSCCERPLAPRALSRLVQKEAREDNSVGSALGGGRDGPRRPRPVRDDGVGVGCVILERFTTHLEANRCGGATGSTAPKPRPGLAHHGGESDCDKLATRCGVARGDENMVWCGVGDLRSPVGSGEYDEYTASPRPASVVRSVPTRFFPIRDPPTRIPSRFLRVVAEVPQALASSVKGIVKKGFTEAHAFEHYGMICLALDEIVCDGVVKPPPGTPSDEPSSSRWPTDRSRARRMTHEGRRSVCI